MPQNSPEKDDLSLLPLALEGAASNCLKILVPHYGNVNFLGDAINQAIALEGVTVMAKSA
ncbi:hypothetical protein [[Limnothrix rosea] IAM M-220]|uniref:hypothetical protein n=1 Tax=[Limnothrix rosea] IAM M-220 TaxID=454133 RepID=UPI0011159D07|nr:hypothetical protein [[Limnothrix rosea] IAM M-220]